MTAEIDILITKLAVKLLDPYSGKTLGSGIAYVHPGIKGQVLVLTAAHCLFRDQDEFSDPFETIQACFYSPSTSSYIGIDSIVSQALVSERKVGDMAIIGFELAEVEKITGSLPPVSLVRERGKAAEFVAKGFPSAAGGTELISISPKWAQHDVASNRFQLHLLQDFSTSFSAWYQVDGFSGSGMFLLDHGKIYLMGIFTRFLDSGKIVVCEYLSRVDELLRSYFLPQLQYVYFGSHGLNRDFFYAASQKAISELGPRFNAEVNLELPIGHYFNSISRDGYFRTRLARAVDIYLTASTYGSGSRETAVVDEHYAELQSLAREWFATIDWGTKEDIRPRELQDKLMSFSSLASKRRSELYDMRYEVEKKMEKKDYHEPYASEISHIGQLIKNNDQFTDALDALHLELADHPIMILKGQAGSGKSHLFGDVVTRMNIEGQPALLLLGQLFQTGLSVWQNIGAQLGLSCSWQEFLSTLNDIGRQTQARVILMVDALNEGAGRALWNGAIAGVIHDVLKYKNIALVISIRSTYLTTVLPNAVAENPSLTTVDHQGFRGNEYEAVKLFCSHYGIRQPSFPIMNPEYANPLFLHLVCQGISASGNRVFPQGFQGITKVFRHYVNAVQQRLVEKRPEYQYHRGLVLKALDIFSKACFELGERRMLTIEVARELFNVQFIGLGNLLYDLIEESVLIRSLPQSRYEEKGNDEEYLYFAYERFGDYYIAEELLKDMDVDNIPIAFAKGGTLGMLMDNGDGYNGGIVEAIAVLLPEKFGLELFEVCSWIYDEEQNYHVMDSSMTTWYMNSLKWRSIESIDDEKFIRWVEDTEQFNVDDHTWFNFLFEMSSVVGHPFNSDRLTKILLREDMAHRDAFLQQFFQYYSGEYDSGEKRPIAHLVDWAWRSGVSSEVDQETARLVAQALTWLLSSTHDVLRDQATKAMVNLLQHQPNALLHVMEKFQAIDDLYVLERLYAVAYGCSLRCTNNNGLESLALFTYQKIFLKGTPPAHLLLRDYARHILDFAIYRGLELEVDITLIHPPYRSLLPHYPTDSEVERFSDEKDEKEPKLARQRQASGAVYHSVIGWDFSRYVIDPAMDSFEIIPFTFRPKLDSFRNGLPRGGKSKLKNLEKMFESYSMSKERRARLKLSSPEKVAEFWKQMDEFYEKLVKNFLSILNVDQRIFFEQQLLPHWQSVQGAKHERHAKLSTRPVKNWIVKRVHELGYDGKLHGDFDLNRQEYGKSGEGRVERIGKKYQWIAYFEILAILADNYKVRERYGEKRSWFYTGPWDVTYRDIDPSFIDRQPREKYPEDEELGILVPSRHWSVPPEYTAWDIPGNTWKVITDDLPRVAECISRIDSGGSEWVYLNSSYTWKESKSIGDSSFRSGRKEIWYLLQCYLVPKTKFQAIRSWLLKQKFSGRWLPEAYDISNLLARENYWSPLSLQLQKEHERWRTLDGSTHKVMLPVMEGMGSLDKDNSGAHSRYTMPTRVLFEALGMVYAEQDGEFLDVDGNLIATNISPLGCMIRKDVLDVALSKLNMIPIWTLTGEKNAFHGDRDDRDIRRSISGVYDFESGSLTGSMKIGDW